MIVFVGAVVIGATGAFFSYTETSTGNTFTAGAIDLTVDSEQHYNGAECVLGDYDSNQTTPNTGQWVGGNGYPVQGSSCGGTWLATDLGAQTFFNFLDIKPGDYGENTISLRIDNNPAWACVDVDITRNDDVSSTEPELAYPDTPEAPDPMDGELAQNLNFFAWAELDGDNVWEPGPTEVALFSNTYGPASDVLGGETYTLADSSTSPLLGGSTSYIGLAWCAGDFAGGVPGVLAGNLACNGASMGNDTQTDSVVADVAFRVEQSRNNDEFTCEEEG